MMRTIVESQEHWRARFVGLVLFLGVIATAQSGVSAAETYSLDEPAADSRVYSVSQTLKVAGTLSAPQPGKKPVVLTIDANGTLAFRERRLAGSGRDAKAFRSLRFYDKASMRAKVNQNVTTAELTDDRRLIVAEGKAGGPLFYSPSGSMTSGDLELLKMPGDALSLLALLPENRIAVGNTWTPPGWAVQMLTGTEAAEKAELTCRLESVAEGKARVSIKGDVKGANDGAATSVQVSGRLIYDLKRGYVERLELQQKEQSKQGPLAPAMDVVANVVLVRSLTENAGPLSAKEASKIPLEPDDESIRVRFDTLTHLRFHHSRRWHMHHQTPTTSTLRMLDRGNFIAQVTVKPLPKAEPGKHVTEKQFQTDIGAALGQQLTAITKAEELKTKDGRYIYRVIAKGKVDKTETEWIYYLCADPTGRQVSLVFTVEASLRKSLGDDHEAFVTSLEFLKR